MATSKDTPNDVLEALKRTKKGQLEYDNHWKEEGRTEEIVNSIKQSLSTLNISDHSSSPNGFLRKTKNEIYNNNQDSSNLINGKSNQCDKSLDLLLNLMKDDQHSNEKPDLNISMTEALLRKYEQERELQVFQRLVDRRQEFYEKKEYLLKNYEDEFRLIQNKYLLEQIKRQKKYEEDMEKLEMDIERQLKQELKEITGKETNQQDKNIKLKEIEEKHKMLAIQEHKKKQEEFKNVIDKIKDNINGIIMEFDKSQQQHPTSKCNETLIHYRNVLLGICQELEVLLLSKEELNIEDIHFCENKFKESLEIQEQYLKILLELKNQSPSKKSDHSIQDISIFSSPSQNSSLNKSNNKSFSKSQPFKSPKDIYFDKQTFLIKFEKQCQEFQQDETKKMLRNPLSIYIRSIINTICNISLENLKEKLIKLLSLFTQKRFEHSEKHYTISENDFSFQFAINIAVTFFLKVSTIHRNISFNLSPVIILLWRYVPMFGDVFLANLFIQCPYAIPYFPERMNQESDLEYHIRMGYDIKDGQLETEESFRTRMFALIELYSSVIQCNMQPDEHPYDLHHAWTWLAIVLNDQPKPQMTALILDAFLSMSAHKLFAIYRKQFFKLIQYIHLDYIDQIESITPKTERQSLMKFKSLIKDVNNKLMKSLPTKHQQYSINLIIKELSPNGIVPDYFFQSSYIFSEKKKTSFF